MAANVEIKHESKAVLYRVQQAMKRERHLVSEAASQAAAARDILVRAPCVLQVIREAASQLGCSHKLSGDIGTPVNKSIITRAMAGESSQFDKLHAAVNSYLDEENIAPYSASRDTVHRRSWEMMSLLQPKCQICFHDQDDVAIDVRCSVRGGALGHAWIEHVHVDRRHQLATLKSWGDIEC